MGDRILVAGASGAIGRRLVPMLRDAGHRVVGLARSARGVERLRSCGVESIQVDVYDVEGLAEAMFAVRPDVVVHQLTDLPRPLDPAHMREALLRNARIREVGTRNLVEAAVAAGVRHIVAQSIAWAYAGPGPHGEDDPLDVAAVGDRAITIRGVAALETRVLGTPGIDGAVLRYGRLYGPGTGVEKAPGSLALHVDAAARAALLAVERRARGVFNIADGDQGVRTERAATVLGWTSDAAGAAAGSSHVATGPGMPLPDRAVP